MKLTITADSPILGEASFASTAPVGVIVVIHLIRVAVQVILGRLIIIMPNQVPPFSFFLLASRFANARCKLPT